MCDHYLTWYCSSRALQSPVLEYVPMQKLYIFLTCSVYVHIPLTLVVAGRNRVPTGNPEWNSLSFSWFFPDEKMYSAAFTRTRSVRIPQLGVGGGGGGGEFCLKIGPLRVILRHFKTIQSYIYKVIFNVKFLRKLNMKFPVFSLIFLLIFKFPVFSLILNKIFKFPDFSLQGICLAIFPVFPVFPCPWAPCGNA